MTSLLAILGLGFLLGMRHAADPDHVLAVTTLVAQHRSPRAAAWIGAVWGLGHTLTIMVVGAGIIGLGWVIPVRLAQSFEFSVGLMLIGLGVVSLRGVVTATRQAMVAAPGEIPPPAAHRHGDYVHTHVHSPNPAEHPHAPDRTPVSWLDRRFSRLRAYQLARPLLVGVVHGLAGSAAVALLVLTTVQEPSWAGLYLLVFGGGTILGMMLITLAVAIPFAYGGERLGQLDRRLRIGAGLASVAFGVFLAWRIGITEGLFLPIGASPP